jgi:hypothetical protein
MSGKIILAAPDEKEMADHEAALKEAGLAGFNLEQFYALRAPWNPTNTARDELIPLGLVDSDYRPTELGEQKLAAYWEARKYTPDRPIVDIVWD